MKMHSFLVVLLSVFLIACGGKNVSTKKSSWDPSKYSVQHGDTLYSIAWRYDLDFKQLARWNSIKKPFLIRPGQRLVMTAPVIEPANKTYLFGGGKQNIARNTARHIIKDSPIIDFSIAKNIPAPPPLNGSKKADSNYKRPVPTYNKIKTNTSSDRPNSQSITKVKNTVPAGPVKWSWPIKGKVISKFAANKHDRKGIDIKGIQNQKILAASRGVVVYSGAGLQSYGKLVIIKHSDRFLSAYAFNKKLLVKEGVRVNKGQTIAIIGKKQTVTNLLHFEIRKDGKPVNPLVYLP